MTRAVKPRDVNKRAWMACHVLRIRTTTQGSRPSPTLAFSSFHRSASAPIIICCSLYFLERALSLLFFSDSLRRSLRTAIVRGCTFRHVCLHQHVISTCDRVMHVPSVRFRNAVVLGIGQIACSFPKIMRTIVDTCVV